MSALPAATGGVGVSLGSLLFLMRPDASQTESELGDYDLRIRELEAEL